MPRSGGESDKLGNRYEAIWTIGQLLELAAGAIDAATIEPFGDVSLGIEFVVLRPDGSRDFHSVKRQRAEGEWSLATLARKEANTGRSIFGDLIGKLNVADGNDCWFVSSTGANDFRELTERARLRKSFAEFEADLKGEGSGALGRKFEKHIQPLIGDWESAYDFLRRMQVTLIDEATLKRQVEQQISFLIYRPDSRAFLPSEVRVLLADFILDHLGTEIRQDAVWKYLARFDYSRRDWASDPTIRDLVKRQNQGYVRAVEHELINDARIRRTESQLIADAATGESGAKTVLVTAAAGTGKSCVLTQSVEILESRDVPVLVVRLDRHGDAHSTREIGKQMDNLPSSPAVVLAGIANGGKCVLVIDQLDAVSQVSGRYPHLWEIFDRLCEETRAYPNMRMVVACRDFDLENDSRLRKLRKPENVEHFKVELLSIEEVDAAIGAAGCAAATLSPAQKEILCTPLHLYLLLEGRDEEQTDVGFSNIGELFDRYWQRKQKAVADRLGQASAWVAVIDKLCEEMSSGLKVYVPYIVLDEYAETRDAMLTEHVLVQDGNQIRFFHESFFDYAYARRFCGTRKSLTELLLSGEQHLFRRSQVRQILAYMRDHSWDLYVAQLRDLLTHRDVRFHIKRLVLAWLGTLPDPTPEEWAVIDSLLGDSYLKRHLLPPIRNSLAWCDLLLHLGVIEEWLASSDDDLITRGLWFLLLDPVQKKRSEIVARLLAPYRNRSPEWTKRLRTYCGYGKAHCGRPMQELFLQLVDDGAFDENSPEVFGGFWHDLHEAGKDSPRFAIEAVAHWLDRRINRADDSLDENAIDLHDRDQTGVLLVAEIAGAEPGAYVDEILPRVLKIVCLTEKESRGRLRRDQVWGGITNVVTMGVSAALLHGLVGALEGLARESPEILEAKVENLQQTESHTIAFLLLRAWSANPTHFGSRCIQFLTSDHRRLDIGYSGWSGGGNGRAAITREAIQACVAHLTSEERDQLERAIISFSLSRDDEDADWTGCLLLESFGAQHLGDTGLQRLGELRAKFPEQSNEIPPKTDSGTLKAVGSPIPPAAAESFGDDEWLSAMREINYGWDSPGRAGSLQGSAVELSRVLQPLARLDRRRFADLTHQMGDSIREEYFEAILDGITGSENLSSEEREADNRDFEELETEVVLKVVRRLHRLPNRPCGRSICRAFEKLADRTIPDEDLEILAYYAVDDPDPSSDDWIGRNAEKDRDSAENAHFYGYNSVRGHAARAIAALLFADYSRLADLLSSVKHLVWDQSLAVRTCAVEALLPMLNHDREEAVRLFLEACDGADIVFGSHPFDNFMCYATSTHYSQLRELLNKALRSTSESTVKTAARQICLASFTDEAAAAAAAADAVRNGTDVMRHAAAEVYAHNLGNRSVSDLCRQHLPQFFADDSEDVRAVAGDCFSHLGDVDLNNFVGLMRTYIESPAFPSQHDDLLRRLDASTWQLPDLTIRIAERFVAEYGSAAGDISTAASADAPKVSKLVVRLYTQSTDDAIRSRCLDLIDEMERLGFYGIDSQLTELDR